MKILERLNVENVDHVVRETEKYFAENPEVLDCLIPTQKAETKHKYAVDLLNRIFDIPVIPENLEGFLFGWAIDLSIKIAVGFFNKYNIW